MSETPPSATNNADSWLAYARRDIVIAELLMQVGDLNPETNAKLAALVGEVGHDDLIEAACHHAQQSAEKAMKAALASHRTPFRKIHHLDYLRNLLAEVGGWDMLPSEAQLDRLSEFAVLGRYPDPDPAPTRSEALSLIALSRSMLRAVEEELARRRRQPDKFQAQPPKPTKSEPQTPPEDRDRLPNEG